MLDDTVSRSLERDPDKRFQSAREMREALEAALREPDIARRRRRRIAYAAIGTLAVALGGAAAFGASKPDVRARAAAAFDPLMQRLRGQPVEATAAIETPEGEVEGEAAAGAAEDGEAEGEAQAEAEASENEVAEASDEGAAPEASEEQAEPAAAETAAAEGESEAEEGEPSESPAKANVAPEAETDEAPAAAEPTTVAQAEKPANDDLDQKLSKASELMEKGSKVKALNMYRRIGRNHRKDARALKAWSEAAVRMRGWGEAYRVAVQWAEIDNGAEARLHLARMERAVGKRDRAMRTLEALLRDQPRCEEARAMLRELNPPPAIARR